MEMIVWHVNDGIHNNKKCSGTPQAKRYCCNPACVSPTDAIDSITLPTPTSGQQNGGDEYHGEVSCWPCSYLYCNAESDSGTSEAKQRFMLQNVYLLYVGKPCKGCNHLRRVHRKGPSTNIQWYWYEADCWSIGGRGREDIQQVWCENDDKENTTREIGESWIRLD